MLSRSKALHQAIKTFKTGFPFKLTKQDTLYKYGESEKCVQFDCDHNRYAEIADFLETKGIPSMYFNPVGVLSAETENRGEYRGRLVLTYLNFYGKLIVEFIVY